MRLSLFPNICAFSCIVTLFAEECRYGSDPNCGFPCNCRSGTCDRSTGECPRGCKLGMPPGYDWDGPGCRIGNVAYNRAADQSSTYRGYAANRSVDGNTNENIHQGSCSHTLNLNHREHAWWRLDLGELFLIENVTIYNRKKSFDRTAHFTLAFGPYRNLQSHNMLCFDYKHVMKDGEHNVFTCQKGSRGRWFSIKRNGGHQPHILNVCKIIINGYVPVDCSLCPNKCTELVGCSTCLAGRKLPDCKDDCPGGYFGVNCANQCGHCSRSQPCNKINGTCMNGCEKWYTGTLCRIHTEIPNCSNISLSDIHINSTSTSISVTLPLDSLHINLRQYYRLRLLCKVTNGGFEYLNGVRFSVLNETHQELVVKNLDPCTEYDVKISPSRIWKFLEYDGISSGIFKVTTETTAPTQCFTWLIIIVVVSTITLVVALSIVIVCCRRIRVSQMQRAGHLPPTVSDKPNRPRHTPENDHIHGIGADENTRRNTTVQNTFANANIYEQETDDNYKITHKDNDGESYEITDGTDIHTYENVDGVDNNHYEAFVVNRGADSEANHVNIYLALNPYE